MPRSASLLSIVLCCLAVGARAEAARPLPHGAAPPVISQSSSKTVRTRKAKSARPPAAAPAIVGSGGERGDGDLVGSAHRANGAGGWSISPEWNASTGGTSAAYGTRALVNELHTNPAETTGYGAGAKVDFHF